MSPATSTPCSLTTSHFLPLLSPTCCLYSLLSHYLPLSLFLLVLLGLFPWFLTFPIFNSITIPILLYLSISISLYISISISLSLSLHLCTASLSLASSAPCFVFSSLIVCSVTVSCYTDYLMLRVLF